MENLFIYIKIEKVNDAIKYGLKLSEYADKVISVGDSEKAGITAFLAPKDSQLYDDNTYACLRITTKDLNGVIYNRVCERQPVLPDFTTKIINYQIGMYEDPVAAIFSTILPEQVSLYNKVMDIPILIENSKDFFYESSIHEMLQNNFFSHYEIYQLLLILGEQKKIFHTEVYDNLKVYEDTVSGKKYTKKSSF